jgi:hypothetical protein
LGLSFFHLLFRADGGICYFETGIICSAAAPAPASTWDLYSPPSTQESLDSTRSLQKRTHHGRSQFVMKDWSQTNLCKAMDLILLE